LYASQFIENQSFTKKHLRNKVSVNVLYIFLCMSKLKLHPKQLQAIGYPNTSVISVALSVFEKHYKFTPETEALDLLQNILNQPHDFWTNPVLSKITEKLVERPKPVVEKFDLRPNPLHFNTFGFDNIEKSAIRQLQTAMRLPVSVAGALMPDAHTGYGLPIGGVLATDNAVIPYAVGVDIGCRMSLSVFPIAANEFNKRHKMLENSIMRHTKFGTGEGWKSPEEHAVLESMTFNELPILKNMQFKAARQLGTSGSGNHFVEFGIATFDTEQAAALNLEAGAYIALLSHSGSRGMGATIANHYTQVAMKKRALTGEAKSLAWLNLDEQEGIEYWLGMSLAGEYSAACHETIHRKIAKEIDNQPILRIENHHNFAWKELIDGRAAIVHRKGATPAHAGELGIIPSSMTGKGYIVMGKGEASSLNSAAHGAGRKMSRAQAKESVSHKALNDLLKKNEVTLLGGGLDEAPLAYKDIEEVMQAQRQLVDIMGVFQPRIVRMDDK
jgi:tRNA-splicing ligase RtcB (3'-phosphate/5'-hydroxy nucleic acid ligase)